MADKITGPFPRGAYIMVVTQDDGIRGGPVGRPAPGLRHTRRPAGRAGLGLAGGTPQLLLGLSCSYSYTFPSM